MGKNVDQQRADEAFTVLEEVRQFVAHMQFYDLMEAMEYEPRRSFKEHMKALLAVGPCEEITHPLQRTLVVSRVMLEAGDKALASKLLSYFPTHVVLGRELETMVGTNSVTRLTPTDD